MAGDDTDGKHNPTAKARTWSSAILAAAAVVAIATVASALINPVLGRVVHWNIVVVLMPSLFVLFAVAIKRRWA